MTASTKITCCGSEMIISICSLGNPRFSYFKRLTDGTVGISLRIRDKESSDTVDKSRLGRSGSGKYLYSSEVSFERWLKVLLLFSFQPLVSCLTVSPFRSTS